MKAILTLWAEDLPRSVPELEGLARLDFDPPGVDPTGRRKVAICVVLDAIDPPRFFDALRDRSVRLVRAFVDASFERDFWAEPPEEWVGSALRPDGHVGLVDIAKYRKTIPLDEPLVINTRPVSDAEHGGPPPHLIEAGGIPIVSEGLLATLRDLGARGKTAQLIYRRHNKPANDVFQPGYVRFLIRPEVEIDASPAVDLLPPGLDEGFGICTFRKSQGEDVWLEIALDRRAAEALRRRRRTVLQRPIFRRDGAVATLLQAVEDGASGLGAGPLG